MEIRPGNAALRGAVTDADGTFFALWSGVAERVELCLFDADGNQRLLDLPECDDGVWHGYVPGCGVGERYGYRVHGPWDPDQGLRCNPAKLLLDPYAREIRGDFDWTGPVFDYSRDENGLRRRCNQDSAPFVPHGVVRTPDALAEGRPGIPWAETIFYECNVRGLTMRHPAVSDEDRGRFSGLRNADVLEYLKALGITSVELMPILAWIDEAHLVDNRLRNYWGYNTTSFFAPMPRLGGADPVAELQATVRAIHDAGLEVILDVAYNHTGEGGSDGPTLSFRGIDNLAYYRTGPADPATYINDTGCGNTINADHPEVRSIVVDSLDYLHNTIGFDGFRFDLATILGRHADGFCSAHPLLAAIAEEPAIAGAKLVAEPWDPGPGGYQLGAFPARWSEWNDDFRDVVRRFWRGDPGKSGDLARRIHGSSDIFEATGRRPRASVNLITTHDGFTLRDVVSYEHRHNEANGEDNRDGHAHNYSYNHGVEGPTDDADILVARHRQRLNLFATLLVSQGTPLILAGDEFGNSQAGNNNAYAQDNETSWLDWSGLSDDASFADEVRELIWLRRENPLLRLPNYVHDGDSSGVNFDWFNSRGEQKGENEWLTSRAFVVRISDARNAVAIVINGRREDARIALPDAVGNWRVGFSSCGNAADALQDGHILLPASAVALLLSGT